MLILGIDEAGRGPVLGPMVLSGVVVPEEEKKQLRELQVADSKSFQGKRGEIERQNIAKYLTTKYKSMTKIISAAEIDAYRNSGKSLNQLEQEVASQIMGELVWDKAILDGANLFQVLTNERVKAYNKADTQYIAVGAASIVAKTIRDQSIASLLEECTKLYGVINGKGYPNQVTLRFLDWYYKKYSCLPSFYRKSYNWTKLEERLFNSKKESL